MMEHDSGIEWWHCWVVNKIIIKWRIKLLIMQTWKQAVIGSCSWHWSQNWGDDGISSCQTSMKSHDFLSLHRWWLMTLATVINSSPCQDIFHWLLMSLKSVILKGKGKSGMSNYHTVSVLTVNIRILWNGDAYMHYEISWWTLSPAWDSVWF